MKRSAIRVAAACALGLLAIVCGADTARAQGAKPTRPSALPVDRAADPLRIAFISYANPQQVARNAQGVSQFLERFVGVPVEGFVTTDYGSSIEAMRNSRADIAFVDPLAFMMAREQIGAEPLVLEVYAGGEASYRSMIWVRKDSGIESLEDLRGKTIAFADQVDMSGHLLPREIFVREGLLSGSRLEGAFFRRVYFAGGDEQAMRALYNGYVDAAGVSQFAYLLLRPDEREQVHALAESIASPSHLVMARKGLDPQIKQRVKQALLALDPAREEDRLLLASLYGVEGYVEAKLEDFASVAAIAARYGFVKQPQRFGADANKP